MLLYRRPTDLSYILCATICRTGKVEKITENFFELVEVYDERKLK